MLVTSNFSFSHNVFHSCTCLVLQNVALCGNGLKNSDFKVFRSTQIYIEQINLGCIENKEIVTVFSITLLKCCSMRPGVQNVEILLLPMHSYFNKHFLLFHYIFKSPIFYDCLNLTLCH